MRSTRSVLVVGLLVGLLGLGVSPAAAEPPPAPEPECADQAPGSRAAAAMAAACDRPVEILDQRSETDEVFAEPDGSTTLRRYAVPQRVRQGDRWADVDTTLHLAADGSVRPAAVPFSLSFSGGGTGPFVRMRDGEPSLALTWPTRLPSPTLDGDTAVYDDVLPGVDLRLTATVEGFEQVLVVEDREAASNPALARIATRVATEGLTVTAAPGGRLAAVDAAGATVFASDGSLMWGANTSETGGGDAHSTSTPEAPEPSEAGAPGAAGTAGQPVAMPVEVQGDQVVVTPDRAMLTAPDTEFPVAIDPPWSRGSGTNWTTVDSCNPGSSYWSSRRDTMRVGRNPDNGCRMRAFVNIDIGDLAGSSIKTASFFSTMDHSSPCGSPTPEVRLAVTTEQWIRPWNAVTWNNTADYNTYWAWVAKIVRPNSANETGSCGGDLGDKLVEWGGDIRDPNNYHVPDVIQWFTNRAYPTLTFGIYSSSEADWTSWKKFYADSSYLQVNYNHAPAAPTGLTISDCSARCSSPAVVSRRDPELRASATDPNGGNLNLRFTVQKADGTTVATSPAVAQASGATPAPWRISPALPADGAYRWSVTSCDEWGDCAGSAWFDFTVDSAPPPAAQVTPADPALYFPEDGSGRSSGGVGVPGRLVLSGYAGTQRFTWRLDSGPPTTVEPTGTGTGPRTATITVTPGADLVRTLTVTLRNQAGRDTTSTYRFRVASPERTAGFWRLDGDALDSRDLSGTPHALRHDGTVRGATFVETTAPGGIVTPRFHGAQFAGTDSTAAITTTHPVLATVRNPATPNSPRSFSVAAWVRFDGTVEEERYRTAVSQQGVNKSNFELGYQAGARDNFCFSLYSADTVGAASQQACATGPVRPGEWVHLSGVYDDAARTATLYVHRINALGFVDVGGAQVVTVPATSSWAANGPFAIGRGYDGAPAAGFEGIVDEVQAAQYAATAEDVQVWAQDLDTASRRQEGA